MNFYFVWRYDDGGWMVSTVMQMGPVDEEYNFNFHQKTSCTNLIHLKGDEQKQKMFLIRMQTTNLFTLHNKQKICLIDYSNSSIWKNNVAK